MTRRRGRPSPAPRNLAAAALLVIGIAGGAMPAARLAASPPAAVPQPALDAVAELQGKIDEVLRSPAADQATVGLEVRSLQSGETLAAVNARKLMMPASATKVVTLAAAADRLGWDYSFRTDAYVVGTITGGTLHGSLVVVGSGDPTIDNWDGAADRAFASFAALLRQQGIRTIAGDVVGDDSVFDDSLGLGPGWAWDDLPASYAAAVSGLQFNQNTAQLAISPGARSGAPVRIEILPAFAPVSIRNVATTESGADAEPLIIRAAARSDVIEVQGAVPRGARRGIHNVAVGNATLYFARALHAGLLANGIAVTGTARDIDELPASLDRSGARLVGSLFTTRLGDMARTMMKVSQNLFAETLLRTVGVNTGSPAAPTRVVASVLNAWGIPSSQFVIVDGSGLSRYNLVTSDALVNVLAHVYQDDRLRDEFMRTLPIAGVDGTLEHRFVGTAAAANLRAKTGSFSNARVVSGYLWTKDHEPLAVTVMANNYNTPTAAIDDVIDRVIVLLAEFSRKSEGR
jgi:D-alanyl-D-alanine carboxypeptidase/D-alanyl-D-alanine-endopeptidase (penicillin-binding protein 4)